MTRDTVREHTRSNLLKAAWLFLLLSAGGCMSSTTLETARVRPLGQFGVLALAGVSAGEDPLLIVISQKTDERTGEATEDIHTLPFERQGTPEFALRGYVGIGAGFEVMIGLESPMVFYGLGGSIGLKWQAPFAGPFSAALSVRAAGSRFNAYVDCDETRCLSTGTLQGRLLMSYAFTENLLVTATPQVGNTWFSVEHRNSDTTFSADALTTGAALGVTWAERVQYHLELTVLYAPRQDDVPGGRWLFIPAIGVSL